MQGRERNVHSLAVPPYLTSNARRGLPSFGLPNNARLRSKLLTQARLCFPLPNSGVNSAACNRQALSIYGACSLLVQFVRADCLRQCCWWIWYCCS